MVIAIAETTSNTIIIAIGAESPVLADVLSAVDVFAGV